MNRDVTISAVIAAAFHVAVLFGLDLNSIRNGPPAPQPEVVWVEVDVVEAPPEIDPMEVAPPEVADAPIEEVGDAPPDPEPEPEPVETEFAAAEIEPEPMVEHLETVFEPEPLTEETWVEPSYSMEEPLPPPPVDYPLPQYASPPVLSSEPAIGPAFTRAPGDYVVLSQPNYRRQAAHYYPALSRQRRETGVVVLTLFISPQGKPERIEVKESSGFPLLDKAAQDMARRSSYMPAFAGTRPVSSIAEASYNFQLK
jgi:periplasmic protein TonB